MAKTLFIFHKYLKYIKIALFIENYGHFMKNCIRPPYEKLKPLKSGFIDNSNFENNRDPCKKVLPMPLAAPLLPLAAPLLPLADPLIPLAVP